MLEIYTFEVTGPQRIHCEGCEKAIERSLAQLPGVRQVQASHRSQQIVVQVDTARTTPQAIEARLDLAGYQAKQRCGP